MRRLPEEMRELLKKPFGPILTGDRLADVMRSAKFLVTVGDVVTDTALKYDLVPHIAVVDGKTHREEKRNIARGRWEREAWVCNPPGCISEILVGVLSRAFNAAARGSKTLVVVEGEEDLASLPCINIAPEGTTVIYGMPDEGAAVVLVDQKIKETVKEIIAQMEMI